MRREKYRHIKYPANLIILLVCFSFQPVNGQSPSFRTYTNPVIPGDHPDATLTRIGNHFYTTGSSFNPTPVIYHSTDLVHWEAIARPVSESWLNYGDTPGGGCWGGHIVYHKSKYWHYFSRGGSMYFVSSPAPEGPWTQPVKVNNPVSLPYSLGYDNSVFIDDDGKWYLVVKNGQPNNGIVELGENGQPAGAVYNLSWLNPGPAYPYSWAEGPVIWKTFGYYYYSFARDLSGGQKVMRSTTLTDNQDSWEMLGDFFNQGDPLKASSLFTEPNHSSPAIMLDDSTSWVIHPLYAKTEWKGQGRQGLLNQVKYDTNRIPVADYPVNRAFTAPMLSGSGIPWMVPKSDFFNTAGLNPEWSFIGYTPAGSYSFTEKSGWLRLSPKSGKRNVLVKNDGEHNYSLITRVHSDPKATGHEAGLIIIRGDESQYVKLFTTINGNGQKIISFTYGSTRYDSVNTIGNTVWLRLVRVNHMITGSYCHDGVNWKQIGNGFDISAIDAYSDFTSFTGTRQGLYVLNDKAYFDLYIYRDAYTSIQCGWPANQYGTIGTTSGTLVNIHNNDWTLYAGVEFGNNNYGKAADSIAFVASAVPGGQVEIWLDSIETGSLVGLCNISSTGSTSVYDTFTAKVTRITGRHDLYLRFTGGSGELFRIKSLSFIAAHSPHLVSAETASDSTIAIVFDKKLKAPFSAEGLSVMVNDTTGIPITGIYPDEFDSSFLFVKVENNLKFSDVISLSYSPGTLQSNDSMMLIAFSDFLVQNLLPDPTPHIIRAETNSTGDSLIVEFNKKMNAPAIPFTGTFSLVRNSNEGLSVDSVFIHSDDSAAIVLKFHPQVFFEDTLKLGYAGDGIVSEDGFLLNAFTDFWVTNNSYGYSPLLISAVITQNQKNTNYIVLHFDRMLSDVSGQIEFFLVYINDQPVSADSLKGAMDSILIYFNDLVLSEDTVTLTYSGGSVTSINNGMLSDIDGFPVQNNIPVGFRELLTGPVKIYPVPFRDEFNIKSEQPFHSVEIYSILGKKVFTGHFPPNTNSALIRADLYDGAYLLIIRIGESVYSTKIIAAH